MTVVSSCARSVEFRRARASPLVSTLRTRVPRAPRSFVETRTHASSSPDSSPRLLPSISPKTAAIVAAPVIALVAATLATESSDLNPVHLYNSFVTTNPIETKACISGVVYSLGDYIAQNYEGRDVEELDASRIVRSGLCGLLAHGPLSHLYYVFLDHAFANQNIVDVDSWLVPVMKIGIDQTIWSVIWNSTYYVLLGLLKFESPSTIWLSVKGSWLDLLKAGWRLWPLAHLVTYGVIPVQHRLLFVDTVELIWVCVLSTVGQRMREEREQIACALPGADGAGGDFAEEILRSMTAETAVPIEVETLGDGTERVTKLET